MFLPWLCFLEIQFIQKFQRSNFKCNGKNKTGNFFRMKYFLKPYIEYSIYSYH
jgi:hypothetical protein